MSALPLLGGAILGGFKGTSNFYKKEEQRLNKIAGLEELAKTTPAERAYTERRRKIIKGGDPQIAEEFNTAIQSVRQQGQFNRQRQEGGIVQSGLEDSIVAQELRRRVDKDILTSVAEQARKMALANAQAKRQAEGELEQMNLTTDARRQQALAKIAGIGDAPTWGSMLTEVGGSMIGGVTSAMGFMEKWDSGGWMDEEEGS